jgi:6-phospho-beta-glucosidase
MAKELKICVIGGGSSYTPEIIEGLIQHRDELPVRQIVLMDIDQRKLHIVGGLAKRMVDAADAGIKLSLTTDRKNAVEGADFVVSQIRVGGMAARILDEKIPLQFGLIGQETTGPGGFAKALRTIPVALSIAKDIETLAPGAFLLNFTNPAGLVAEALLRYSPVKSIGLCNIPIGTEMRLVQELGVRRSQLRLDWIGLNHLNWLRGVRVDGRDVWPQVFEAALEEARQESEAGWGFSAELLETLSMIPCSYLNYYYHTDHALEKQKAAPRSRGEEVREIEDQLMQMYQDPGLTVKPALLEKRGGAYYSTAAVSLISAIYNDKKEVHVVNTTNRGAALPGLPEDAVVEIACEIGTDGPIPLAVQPMPEAVRGLVQAVKAYESLAVKAGVEGDRRAALQALLAHPLVHSFEATQAVLDALLSAHCAYLPQFFPEK